jgi:hypothetical protein
MMKKITLCISLFVAGTMAFMACQKEAKVNGAYETTDGSAFLRVVNAAPSFRQVFNLPDSFNVYVNGAKVSSPFLTYASTFPASGTNFGYLAVPPGLQQIKLSVNGFSSTNYDSTLITNFTKVFQAGQYYTLLVTDSIKSPKDSSQMFLPDVYTKPLPGNVAIRFVHTVWNDTATKTVDLYSYARNNTVLTNYKPGQISGFTALGYNIGVADTFYVTRNAPAGTLLANRIVLAKLALGVTNQRVYTLYFRGDGNLTTGTKARSLASYLHQ